MIRPADRKDSLGMGRVYCIAWQEAYRGIIPQAYLDGLTPQRCAPTPDRISPEVSRVFEINGEIVGLVNFGSGRTPVSENLGELRSIYLLPEYWSKGIGSQLFLEAKAELKNDGYDGFYLWVLCDNHRACRFYEKMGMISTNVQKIDQIGGEALIEVKYEYRF